MTSQLILENSTIIIFTEKVYTPGLMAESMKENGEQTKCMVKVPLVGLMDENTLDNTQKIKREDMENLFGQTGDVTEENG